MHHLGEEMKPDSIVVKILIPVPIDHVGKLMNEGLCIAVQQNEMYFHNLTRVMI